MRIWKSRITTIPRPGEIDVIHDQAQGRTKRTTVLDHRLQAFIIHPRGMENDIRAGARRIEHTFGAARMHHDLLAQAVRLPHHSRHFVLIVAGNQHIAGRIHGIAVDCDLDKIDAIFDFKANLRDALSCSAAEHAD